MSVEDSIRGWLAEPVQTGFQAGPKTRLFASAVAAVAAGTSNTLTATFNLIGPWVDSDAIWFEQLTAALTPTAAGSGLSVLEAEVLLNTNLPSLPLGVAQGTATALGLRLGSSVAFSFVRPLLTMRDIVAWYLASGVPGAQPQPTTLQVRFSILNQSASDFTVNLVALLAYRHVQGLQEL